MESNRGMDRLLLNKLTHPALPPTILHRQELIQTITEWVNQVERRMPRIVLLCAPAGYGKTTLLADVAEHLSLPCCWYFLDAADEQPTTFLQLLVASIRQHFSAFGLSLDSSLRNIVEVENSAQKLQYLEFFIDVLAKTIEKEIPERFILLFCNYHEIGANSATNYLVNRFVQRVPPRCTLVLESRSTPRLGLTVLKADEHILRIGISQLRFSQEEIRRLAHLQQADLTEQEAKQLEEAFDGWITGILLGTHLGNFHRHLSIFSNSSNVSTLPLKRRREHLFAYLVRYVFAHQSDIYPFLMETAILRQMTPALCNALLDISDADTRLIYLEERGLFITHYNTDSGSFFLCHPVVREFLSDELRRTNPARFTELHLRAVELFRAIDDDEAIAHALAARSFDIAVRLIETASTQQFAQGRLTTLASWIDSLPPEVLNSSPRLLLVRATIFLEESALTKVQQLLEQALEALQSTEATPALRAEILLAQAKLLLQQGDYAQAQSMGRQALALLPPEEVETLAAVHQLLGSCAAYFNNFSACIVELQQALQLHRYNTGIRQVAKLHSMLANFYGMTGHNALSEHHRTRAICCWENIQDGWGKIDDLIGLGAIKERQGMLAEAEQLFAQALTLSRGAIHYECGEAYALASLGDVYQDRDDFRRALAAFDDSLTLSRQLNETYLTHYLLCQISQTYQLMGDPQSALHIITQLEQNGLSPEPGKPYSYEQALYALTLGTLLLQKGQTAEAYDYLTAAESAFSETKHECLQAMMRRAACMFAQKKTQAALRQVECALHLAREYGYEKLVEKELIRSPALLAYVQTTHLAQTIASEETEPPPTVSPDGQTLSVISSRQNFPALSIQALGSPVMYKDDMLIKHWRSSRSMELFFLLLDAAYPLPKEQIIAALWQDEEAPTDQIWRSTLHYLRNVVGTECVKSLNSMYTLQLETKYTIRYDVEHFQDLYAQAQIAQHGGDDEAAGQAFEAMVDLYQGDFVAPFSHSWCMSRRDELRRMYIDAHHQLANRAWKLQQPDKSLAHWQHILDRDHTIEAAHAGAIRCYLQQGHRHLALRQYNRCVAILQSERGRAPGQMLQSLYQRITETA